MVDLHAAVDEINHAQKLALRAHGPHCGPELRLPVVGQEHVLEEHALLLRYAQLPGGLRRRLGPHHQMAQQLAPGRVLRHQPQGRGDELVALGKVVEQGPRQQQAPVDHRRVQPRQVVRRAHHVQRVHQQAPHKAVVHALSRRDGGKPLPVPVHHPPADGPVVAVLYALHHRAQLLHGRVRVDGGHRHQIPQVVPVPLLGQAQAGDNHLRGAAKLVHRAPYLQHLPLVRRTHRPAVVPDLGLDGPGPVRQHGAEKGLSAVGDPGLGGLEDVEALRLVPDLQLGDQLVVFHNVQSRPLSGSASSCSMVRWSQYTIFYREMSRAFRQISVEIRLPLRSDRRRAPSERASGARPCGRLRFSGNGFPCPRADPLLTFRRKWGMIGGYVKRGRFTRGGRRHEKPDLPHDHAV